MARANNGGPKAAVRETEVRELPVKLTDAELLERADAMSAAELEIETLSIERQQLTKKINDQKRTRAELAHVIDKGEEPRQVRCSWHEDFQKNVFRLKRDDTGAEVDTRPMTSLDRTGRLFDDATAANDTADDEDKVPPPRRIPSKPTKGKKKAAAASRASASIPNAVA